MDYKKTLNSKEVFDSGINNNDIQINIVVSNNSLLLDLNTIKLNTKYDDLKDKNNYQQLTSNIAYLFNSSNTQLNNFDLIKDIKNVNIDYKNKFFVISFNKDIIKDNKLADNVFDCFKTVLTRVSGVLNRDLNKLHGVSGIKKIVEKPSLKAL